MGETKAKDIFCLTQYIPNIIISVCNRFKIMNEVFCILVRNPCNLGCTLHRQHISMWTNTFQVLSGPLWSWLPYWMVTAPGNPLREVLSASVFP